MDTSQAIEQYMEMPPMDIGRVDVGLLNLLCAPSLPGSESLDLSDCLARLDRLTAFVKAATERGLPNFRKDPDFGHSEPMWRMAMLVTKIKRDYGATYDPDVAEDLREGRPSLFTDSRNVFIHGLLDKNPKRRWGSCTSMPTLIVAVARRLGYPVGLAATTRHHFARWEDARGTVFNIEASGPGGMEFYPDEHYRHWPKEMSAEGEKSGFYLRTLYPAEEFGCHMQARVHCLTDAARYDETFLWSARALQFAPDAPTFPEWAYMAADTAIKHRYRQLYPDRPIPPGERNPEFFFDLGKMLLVQERSLFLTIAAHFEESKGHLENARRFYEDACRQNRWGNNEPRDLQRFLKKHHLTRRPGRLMPPTDLGQPRHFLLKVKPEEEADLLCRMTDNFVRQGKFLEASYALQDLYLFDPCNAEIYERYRALQRHPECQRQLLAAYDKKGKQGKVATKTIKGPLNILNN